MYEQYQASIQCSFATFLSACLFLFFKIVRKNGDLQEKKDLLEDTYKVINWSTFKMFSPSFAFKPFWRWDAPTCVIRFELEKKVIHSTESII